MGVVVDGAEQPAWICRVIDFVRARHTLAFVRIAGPAKRARRPLLQRLFARFDDRLFAKKNDGVSRCEVTPLDGDAASLVIAFAAYDARDEAWRVDLDGWDEFVRQKPFTEAVLLADGKAIARTTGMRELVSFRRASARIGMRAAAMIEEELDRRARGGALPPLRATKRETVKRATQIAMATRIASSAREWLLNWYRGKFTNRQWFVGISFDGTRRFHEIVPPKDRMWADPFVVADGDRAWIYVEEMYFSTERGTLAVIEARRDGTWSPPQPVLELPIHLSYPCVFRWNGELFMVPDTRFNKTIELYRCVEAPAKWELDRVLLTNMDAVDPTVFEAHGKWWMYVATPSGDRAGLDRLSLYHAPNPRGPWTPHPWNPLECDVMGGRGGGRPFLRDGKLLRAVQLSTPYYGHSIGIREIVKLSETEWEERHVETIGPEWAANLAATHTLNVDGGVMVVDGMRFRRR
ncbi:MAG TPA: hypothetical protein VND45_16600 [Thermoanaerobaculia bacterium]|nr:hypothetical protein [Thermoanaerobaculia bacterium]